MTQPLPFLNKKEKEAQETKVLTSHVPTLCTVLNPATHVFLGGPTNLYSFKDKYKKNN